MLFKTEYSVCTMKFIRSLRIALKGYICLIKITTKSCRIPFPKGWKEHKPKLFAMITSIRKKIKFDLSTIINSKPDTAVYSAARIKKPDRCTFCHTRSKFFISIKSSIFFSQVCRNYLWNATTIIKLEDCGLLYGYCKFNEKVIKELRPVLYSIEFTSRQVLV